MLTVVMPSFHSSEIIKERIEEIDKKIPIIIIENSKNIILKEKLEKQYNNINVIIPKENLGWGKAVNIGIKQSVTPFVFITQPDVKLIDDCLSKLITCIREFKNFTILTPKDLNNKIYNNFEIYNKHDPINSKNEFSLKEVDYVDLTWLINKSNFDDSDLWDEKMFLYFEAQDFAKRLKKKKKKIYVADKINTFHIGSSSHDKKLEYFSNLNRNWHFNWSRHYYYKKHYGFMFAYRKSTSILIKLIMKILKNLIFFNTKQLKLTFVEIFGLLSSMINLPSFYRPYKKIKF